MSMWRDVCINRQLCLGQWAWLYHAIILSTAAEWFCFNFAVLTSLVKSMLSLLIGLTTPHFKVIFYRLVSPNNFFFFRFWRRPFLAPGGETAAQDKSTFIRLSLSVDSLFYFKWTYKSLTLEKNSNCNLTFW